MAVKAERTMGKAVLRLLLWGQTQRAVFEGEETFTLSLLTPPD